MHMNIASRQRRLNSTVAGGREKKWKAQARAVDFSCWERRRPGGNTFMKTNALVSDRTVPARRQRS